MPKKLTAYTTERQRKATYWAMRYAGARQAALALLPESVRLTDGRTLARLCDFDGGYAYSSIPETGLRVIVTHDGTPHGLLRHLSCSYHDRLPTWDEVGMLRDAFFPADWDVIQVLPRPSEYVNVHSYTLHLFQSPETWQGGLLV